MNNYTTSSVFYSAVSASSQYSTCEGLKSAPEGKLTHLCMTMRLKQGRPAEVSWARRSSSVNTDSCQTNRTEWAHEPKVKTRPWWKHWSSTVSSFQLQAIVECLRRTWGGLRPENKSFHFRCTRLEHVTLRCCCFVCPGHRVRVRWESGEWVKEWRSEQVLLLPQRHTAHCCRRFIPAGSAERTAATSNTTTATFSRVKWRD